MILSRSKHFVTPTAKRFSAGTANVRALRGGDKRRQSRLARGVCLLAALVAFVLLPAAHVLVHEHEDAQARRAMALHAARARLGAYDHHQNFEQHTHDHHAPAQHPQQHSGKPDDGHGRYAPEHLAAAALTTAALPLILPATLLSQLTPRTLLDRLYAVTKVRSHATRASPLC